MRRSIALLGIPAITAITAVSFAQAPSGTDEDQRYGERLWAQLEARDFVGGGAMMSRPNQGSAPHGEYLVTLEHELEVDGETGPVLVKRNYTGEDISAKAVSDNPGKYLDSITVMYQRDGYDPENNDWFWAKYQPDGSFELAPEEAPLAGRATGCITCHSREEDRVFLNDRY